MSAQDHFAAAVLQAWNGSLDFSQLLTKASALERERQWPLVAVLYQTWLKRNTSPYQHAGWFNLGAALASAEDYAGAEEAYRQALALAPGFLQPRLNLGYVYERTGRIDAAIAEWDWIEQHVSVDSPADKPLLLMAVNQLGRVTEAHKRYDKALAYLTRSLVLEPDQPDVLHHWVYLRERQCAWPVYQPLAGVSPRLMRDSTSALAMLNISDDPAAQLDAARKYVSRKLTVDVPALSDRHSAYGHPRLRIGYCSSDFSLHPVSMLTAQMFELHDRSRFEVCGYCWSPEDGSPLRKRVIDAMDRFVRIDRMNDEEAAKRIREDEIDVLVDLQGQTAGARPNMLALRPAPIQITYLGLPATTGFPFIDYVIADRFLIPEEALPFYSETPLYMPHVYQVSDRKRTVGPRPTRQSCGLPEGGFVFCSFNNNYKYTPEVFTAWMNILRRVPGSVLWLLADNPWAEANLRREAAQRGIDAARLVFASRTAPETYLARFLVADLFLDTFPFNAGTTANDALWAGLPLLTLSGRSFASRMAGALLTAAGMPELITFDLEDYERKAAQLAGDPQEMVRLRERLGAVRSSGALFDTPAFVKQLEQRLQELVGGLQHAVPRAARRAQG